MSVATLDLDLDVFQGPFDLLLTLVLREEVDLLEVALADVVLAYVDHLEQRGELDLEAATEFLVLIAALLELKSRLMLPREDEELLELEPGEAAEELLARMLEARRYRRASSMRASSSSAASPGSRSMSSSSSRGSMSRDLSSSRAAMSTRNSVAASRSSSPRLSRKSR